MSRRASSPVISQGSRSLTRRNSSQLRNTKHQGAKRSSVVSTRSVRGTGSAVGVRRKKKGKASLAPVMVNRAKIFEDQAPPSDVLDGCEKANGEKSRGEKTNSPKLGLASAPAASPPPRLCDLLEGPADQKAFVEAAPPGQLRLVWGRSGDHAAVYHMLLAVFQSPSREEFQAQTEDPFYEPTDRLLVKRGFRVLSHLHLTRRTMQFGRLPLPVTGFQWLATLPEFRSQGLATRLLVEGERRMAADGAVLGLLRTRVPHFFHRTGWAVCGRHHVSRAKAREVLGHLQVEHAQRFARRLNIRLWRHVEMPALERIYRQNCASGYGCLERTEAYWRWLVGRKAFSSLLIALDGPDKLDLEESRAPIVGYAVMRQERVVELLIAPGHPDAGVQLLARACGDAIEHNRQEIFLHASPQDGLHRLMADAGGTCHHQEVDQGEVYMVRVVDPLKFLQLIGPELDERAKQAGLPRGVELGLSVGGSKWRLVSSRRGFRVRTGHLGRSYLTLNRAEFTRLVLGHGQVRETVAAGRIQASTQTALDLANALFPQLPLWRPTWDDLPV